MTLRRRTILQLPLLASAAPAVFRQALQAAEKQLKPSVSKGLLHFAVMGDSGSGSRGQQLIARQLERQHGRSPFEFVLTTGDNVYEYGETAYFDRKFIDVYRKLLDDGVLLRATLGNHDMRNRSGQEQIQVAAFGYEDSREEYQFEAGPMLPNGKRLARFICLNSNRWDEEVGKPLELRLGALREKLAESDRYQWNIAYFHHPLYSYVKSGFLIPRGHGANEKVRRMLEPELIDRVDVVFSGHDHFYQKIKPQHGIDYFVTGGAGKLRGGVQSNNPNVEKAALEYHFMDLSLDQEALRFQAINDDGAVIHGGAIAKRGAKRLSEIRAAA